MRFWTFATVAITCLCAVACTPAPSWTLFYYQGQQTLPATGQYQAISGYYQSLEQCQQKAKGMEYLSGTSTVYQCGFQCKLGEHDVVECDQWHTFTPEQ
ncbi:hypothetical protein JYB87_16975 [Shewanella avicenniae]|uniref:Secreted protein n=1 Tax=Shewanella avicenniae TaxID=2814294 RepID=A0ABX7QPJ5_9GAMM|nr:hypothetical protein [Shewanella avicenniae]QSX33387.1 hypothetical protein JYB87_16975 [Shewanella avicenniae]